MSLQSLLVDFAFKVFQRLQYRAEAKASDLMLRRAFDFATANLVEGDYLEFGCFGANTFRSAFRHSRDMLFPCHLYAFDSFEGLPDPTGVDETSKFFKGKYSMDLARFRKVVEKAGVASNEYTCVPGFYNQSLTEELRTKLPLTKAAVVYVDCDLYESTVDVLTWLKPYLQQGTIVCFDDFYLFKGDRMKGESLALIEFIRNNPEFEFIEWHPYGWCGRSFIVSIVAPSS